MLPGPPETVIVVSSLPWPSRTVRLSSTLWHKVWEKKTRLQWRYKHLCIYGCFHLQYYNVHVPTKTSKCNTSVYVLFNINLKTSCFSLTPSGFTSLVTVTDWKNDLVFGRFGVWPADGANTSSRPPEDTAESRSEQEEKNVSTIYLNSFNKESKSRTSVFFALFLWSFLWSLLPNIMDKYHGHKKLIYYKYQVFNVTTVTKSWYKNGNICFTFENGFKPRKGELGCAGNSGEGRRS